MNGQVRVVVARGDLTCTEATDIFNRYFFDPDTPVQGSSAFANVGEWFCYIDTIPSPYLGACERTNPDGSSRGTGNEIEMYPA